jgi:hypothetical protein
MIAAKRIQQYLLNSHFSKNEHFHPSWGEDKKRESKKAPEAQEMLSKKSEV